MSWIRAPSLEVAFISHPETCSVILIRSFRAALKWIPLVSFCLRLISFPTSSIFAEARPLADEDDWEDGGLKGDGPKTGELEDDEPEIGDLAVAFPL